MESSAEGSAPFTEAPLPEEGPPFVEFIVTDAAAQPISGVPYRLKDPAGEVVDEGTLAEDGKVRKDGAEPGLYELELGLIDTAKWVSTE